LLKKNKPDEAKAFMDKNADAFARGASASSFNTVMRNYQNQMQSVTVDPNLTPEQKRERLEDLRAKRTAYAEKMQQMMQR
jgi:Spy/CpxP family protein refolding chaperone